MVRLQHELWTKLRTGRKPPSFWQRPALSGVSLQLGWSQALISDSPLTQSAAKTQPFVWWVLSWLTGTPSWRDTPLKQSTKSPGAQAFSQGFCQCVRWVWMRGWVQYAPAAQLQIEIQLRQIRWCAHFLHVFLMLSWFCKHYRRHVLRV